MNKDIIFNESALYILENLPEYEENFQKIAYVKGFCSQVSSHYKDLNSEWSVRSMFDILIGLEVPEASIKDYFIELDNEFKKDDPENFVIPSVVEFFKGEDDSKDFVLRLSDWIKFFL